MDIEVLLVLFCFEFVILLLLSLLFEIIGIKSRTGWVVLFLSRRTV